MKRRYRLLVTAAVIGGCIAGFAALTALSSRSQGPLTAALERAATGVGRVEQAIRRRLGGPERSDDLRWFQRYRREMSLLRYPDSVLVGAYDGGLPLTLDGIVELERGIGISLPLIQVYSAWGDRPEQQFPLQLLTAIWDFGSVPVVTWEPWLTDFESARHPHLPLRDARERNGLTAIAGGEYDFYIDEWAKAAARFDTPFYLRFAHEMNDPYRYPWGPQNNTKEEYIAAWRHTVDRFRLAGANKVIWVWSPHVAYEYWDLYYPGDEYVDWVATGVLNYGPIAQWSQWWSFDQIFGSKYARLARFNKPIMLAELGSLSVGGDRAAWYRGALQALPQRYPAVRAALFFHSKDDQTVTYQKVDWTITGDTAALSAVIGATQRWAPGPRRIPAQPTP